MPRNRYMNMHKRIPRLSTEWHPMRGNQNTLREHAIAPNIRSAKRYGTRSLNRSSRGLGLVNFSEYHTVADMPYDVRTKFLAMYEKYQIKFPEFTLNNTFWDLFTYVNPFPATLSTPNAFGDYWMRAVRSLAQRGEKAHDVEQVFVEPFSGKTSYRKVADYTIRWPSYKWLSGEASGDDYKRWVKFVNIYLRQPAPEAGTAVSSYGRWSATRYRPDQVFNEIARIIDAERQVIALPGEIADEVSEIIDDTAVAEIFDDGVTPPIDEYDTFDQAAYERPPRVTEPVTQVMPVLAAPTTLGPETLPTVPTGFDFKSALPLLGVAGLVYLISR